MSPPVKYAVSVGGHFVVVSTMPLALSAPVTEVYEVSEAEIADYPLDRVFGCIGDRWYVTTEGNAREASPAMAAALSRYVESEES